MSTDIVCRVCETPRNLEFIFKRENDSILQMLREVARVSVEEQDTLPKCICSPCIARLENAHEFILECNRTDRKWRTRTKSGRTKAGPDLFTPTPHSIKKSPRPDEILEAFYDDREDRYRSSQAVKSESGYDLPETVSVAAGNSSLRNDPLCNGQDPSTDTQTILEALPPELHADEDFDGSDDNDPTYKPDENQPADDVDVKADRPIKRRKKRTTPKEPKPPKPRKERKPREKVPENNEPIHPCPICQKMLTKRGLLAHMETHGERHICQMCGKQYSQRTGLNRHIRHFHNQYRPHICQICGKGFPRVSALQMHQATHGDEKKHRCDKCDRTFKTHHCLNIHRKIHGDTTLLCGTCGQTFNDIPSQLAHIRTHRNHQCSTCSKRFATVESLKIHEARHINEKIHNCNHCEATFRRMCDLHDHLLTHPESRPYQCKVCGNAYRHRGGLYAHALVHKGGKLYKCELCPKKFMRRFHLNRHSMKHEKEGDGKTMSGEENDNAGVEDVEEGEVTTNEIGPGMVNADYNSVQTSNVIMVEQQTEQQSSNRIPWNDNQKDMVNDSGCGTNTSVNSTAETIPFMVQY